MKALAEVTLACLYAVNLHARCSPQFLFAAQFLCDLLPWSFFAALCQLVTKAPVEKCLSSESRNWPTQV